MELRHLRYFVAAAEELHFRRAAERLGIAQPALSQQIQQLEQEIEALLFHRLTRGVELTDAGKAFLDDARVILEHVEQAKAKAQRVARGDQGMIRIGFTGSASFNPIVPGVIQDYRARFPGIAVSLVESRHLAAGRQPARRAGRCRFYPLAIPRGRRSFRRFHPRGGDADCAAVQARSGSFGIITSRSAERRAVYLVSAGQQPGTLRQDNSGLPTRRLQPQNCPTGARSRVGPKLDRCRGGRFDVPASMQHMQPRGVAYRAILGDAPRAPLSLAHRSNEPSAAVRNLAALARRAAATIGRDTPA